ncbi:hypothetical protein Golob_027638, partial [Gossypium lobatum]|nr:hypothetical protein [Gossypium lobatum]
MRLLYWCGLLTWMPIFLLPRFGQPTSRQILRIIHNPQQKSRHCSFVHWLKTQV